MRAFKLGTIILKNTKPSVKYRTMQIYDKQYVTLYIMCSGKTSRNLNLGPAE